MTDVTVETTVTGGQIQGVAGAGTVLIENFTIYNRVVEEPAAADATSERIPPCPYPGLAYFGPEDADLFFGRDAAIARLAEAVGRQRLTALVGASGSGKSSVVLAGLAPRLHSAGGWRFSHFRIGTELDNNPFLALARALVPLYVTSQSDTDRLLNTRQLAEGLDTGRLTLPDVFADCRSRNKSTRILLIADQFEEAFTLVDDEALLHRFINVLLAGFPDSAPGTGLEICLVLTLRADFYGQALRHRPLADALQGRIENLGPMNREELHAAIRNPAESVKVSFDPGLVETLLDDVENKPGSLPLLQFALREMWGRQQNGKITRTSYDDIGGVEGALAQRAEAIFAAMTENGADAPTAHTFRRLLTRLVTLGEGQEDTRRVVDRRELGDEAWSLAQRLAGEDNRLVVTNAPAFSRETAEVVHEALIRHWPRLVDWIDRDRAFQSWLRQIGSNVELWSADPSDQGPLLRGGMLAQARDWLARRRDDLSPAELSYIEASLASQRRADAEREAARQAEISRQQQLAEAAVKLANEQRRRARIAVIGGILAFVLAVFATVAGYEAFTAKHEAERSASAAYIAKKRADENATAAELATTRAEVAAKQAEAERDIARMQLLAMQARRTVIEADTPYGIERAGALALESIEIARKSNRPTEADAVEAVRSALTRLPLQVLSHGSPVKFLAVLGDGRLASGDEDGQIKLWPRDGAGEPMILRHGSKIGSLAVLADGRLASGGDDGKIKLWPEEGTGEPVVLTHGSPVRSLAVMADGRLASGGDDRDGTIKLWPRDSVGEPVVLRHGSPALFLAVLADGRLASSGEFGQIKLWPRDGVGEPVALPHKNNSARLSLMVLADGRLASGDFDGQITLWPRDGVGEPLVLAYGGSIGSLALLADGRLASSGFDGQIKLWPRDNVGEPVVLSHGGAVRSLVVLADGRLASGGQDGKIKLWPRDGVGEPMVLRHGSAVLSLAVLPDGRLASGGGDGKIKLWPRDGMGDPMVLSQGSMVLSLVVLPDGRLASGGYDRDGTIKLWPRDSVGEPVIQSQGSPVWSLAVMADGRLASGGGNGQIKLWPRGGVGEPLVFAHGRRVLSLVELVDGQLASGDEDGHIKLWPRDGVGEPRDLQAHLGGWVWSLVVLADGRLASSGFDGQIRLWPREVISISRPGGKFVLPTFQHGGFGSSVQSLAVLADGRLASGGDDGKIKLWPEEGTGEPVVLTHGSPVRPLAVMVDGRLASGGNDGAGTIKLWRVEEKELIAALCLRPGRNLTNDEWVRYIGSETPRQPSCRDRPSNWRTPD
jgi:WD40 repeat protein